MSVYSSKRVKKSEGKSDVSGRPAQPPKCPECGSERIWKDGIRYTVCGEIQRFLCRDCGLRFSDHINKNLEAYSNSCRVCASKPKAAKNLAKVETQTENRLAGATKPLQKITNTNTIVTIFKDWMQRQGYKSTTCNAYAKRIKILLQHLNNRQDTGRILPSNSPHTNIANSGLRRGRINRWMGRIIQLLCQCQ